MFVFMRRRKPAQDDFNESDHPRKPAGSEGGGEFTSGAGGRKLFKKKGGKLSEIAGFKFEQAVEFHFGKSIHEKGQLFKRPDGAKVTYWDNGNWTFEKEDTIDVKGHGLRALQTALEAGEPKAVGQIPAKTVAETMKDWQDRLKYEAIQEYAATGEITRRTPISAAEALTIIQHLHEIIGESSLPHAEKLYRGFQIPNDQIEQLKPGQTINLSKGFVATTRHEDDALTFAQQNGTNAKSHAAVLCTVEAPAGSQAWDQEAMGGYEVLFDINARFRVKSIQQTSEGEGKQRFFRMTVVPVASATAEDSYALDEFVESKHPRKPAGQEGGGQFTAGAGGGSSSGGAGSTVAGKYIVNSHVGLVLKKYNYVKGKDIDGNLTFYGPNGHKVIVHAPDIGKKSSSAWSLYKPDQSVIKKAGIQLENYLAKAHAQKPAEPPKMAEPPKPAGGNMTSVISHTIAQQHGFHLAEEKGDITTYEHPNGAMFSISKTSGAWSADFPGTPPQDGSGNTSLTAFLKKAFEHKAHPNEEHAAAFNSSMAKLGYGKLKEDDSTVTYKKTAGGKVSNITYIKIGPKADTWTCETQGHMTKQGSGVNALEQLLMYGKVAPGVTNVQPAPSVPNAATVTPKEHVQLYKKLQAASKAPVGSQAGHVENYKGSGYHHINDCLRFKDNCADPAVPKIEAWLNDNALPEDVTLWRGVKGEYAKVLKSIVMVGTKFKDRGFVSTSTSNEFSKNWGSGGGLLLKIKAKKGLKGATISQNFVDSEYEVLLQRNTHFHVTAYDPKTGILEVEALQEE